MDKGCLSYLFPKLSGITDKRLSQLHIIVYVLKLPGIMDKGLSYLFPKLPGVMDKGCLSYILLSLS